MFSLILAGEAIFGLPFHITRFFRPTFEKTFEYSQTNIGELGSLYGWFALLSYPLGGLLADRFSVRTLLSFALVITGAAGLWMLSIPSFGTMKLLFAFWGVSTILPFWAALIKATREWGGDDRQGVAFGILDGGRGAWGALLATIALVALVAFLGDFEQSPSPEDRETALKSIIWVYIGACGIAALFVWLFVPATPPAEIKQAATTSVLVELRDVLSRPAVWLQSLIILAAYCAFKGTDYYAQFSHDVWGWSEQEAARLGIISNWVRPVAAIGAGLVADRLSSVRVLIASFVLSGVSYIGLAYGPPGAAMVWLIWTSVITGCLGVYAMRGVYFALLEDSNIPPHLTGMAVGTVSFLGFTPEIFMPKLGGYLIDRWDGAHQGYAVLFICLLGASTLGVAAAVALQWVNMRRALQPQNVDIPPEEEPPALVE